MPPLNTCMSTRNNTVQRPAIYKIVESLSATLFRFTTRTKHFLDEYGTSVISLG